MGAIKSLFNSEKALFVGLLIIAATVLTAIGKMSVDAWTSYTQILAGIYVSGKTIQGTAAVIMSKGGEVGHPAREDLRERQGHRCQHRSQVQELENQAEGVTSA